MRIICMLAPGCTLDCSQSDRPRATTNVQKQGSAAIGLDNLVHVAGPSADEHPLVCGIGGDFPAGRELAFKHAESRELVHAVFPAGVTPPESLDGKFVLHGHFQNIQNMARYTRKKPSQDHRYLVVSSWEHSE